MRTMITTAALFTGFAAAAQMVYDYHSVQDPGTLETDSHGNLWVNYHTDDVVDTYHLAKINPNGIMDDVISTTLEISHFGVNDSIIWIASPTVEKVYKYNHNGELLDSVNASTPAEILLDSDGTWYMAQSGSGRILRFAPDNLQTIIASGFPLDDNFTLSRDENGIFYSCNRQNAALVRVDAVTGDKTEIAVLPEGSPYSVSSQAYRDGYLYVTSGLHCVYRIDTAGMDMTVLTGIEGTAGDSNGAAGMALLNQPTGVAFSVTGDTLFIADRGNQKIKVVTGMLALGQSEQELQTGLSICPNPASGLVRVTSGQNVSRVAVSDANGRCVTVSVQLQGSVAVIDVSELPEGVYFIDVLAGEEWRRSRLVRT